MIVFAGRRLTSAARFGLPALRNVWLTSAVFAQNETPKGGTHLYPALTYLAILSRYVHARWLCWVRWTPPRNGRDDEEGRLPKKFLGCAGFSIQTS